jgi:hypothetical protein
MILILENYKTYVQQNKQNKQNLKKQPGKKDVKKVKKPVKIKVRKRRYIVLNNSEKKRV